MQQRVSALHASVHLPVRGHGALAHGRSPCHECVKAQLQLGIDIPRRHQAHQAQQCIQLHQMLLHAGAHSCKLQLLSGWLQHCCNLLQGQFLQAGSTR